MTVMESSSVSLAGRVALVTGAAQRVGRQIALHLAQAGAAIVVHYHRSADAAERTAADVRALGVPCWLARADLAHEEEVRGLLDRLAALCPPVDILINNASVFYATPLDSDAAQRWDAIMAVNLRAPFLLAGRLGPDMARRGWGRIVNIGDCSTRRPYKHYLPYLVSKAALLAATRCLAVELAPSVTVNAVSPGIVLPPSDGSPDYEERMRRTTLLQRLGTPEDVARAVVFLVRDAPFTTGAEYVVDGGASVR
ncbi:MAG: SDR family oxidoreductase [Candidatus Sumerlaeaceae bacterium]|nr:SDR family oxidoreductase [Candidatus Sumerlaeaceae bacterium]